VLPLKIQVTRSVNSGCSGDNNDHIRLLLGRHHFYPPALPGGVTFTNANDMQVQYNVKYSVSSEGDFGSFLTAK
jgi:hypothetical protein